MPRKLVSRKETFVNRVKSHALENYSKGWDVVIECYTNEELGKSIGAAETIEEAIQNVAFDVNLWNEKKEEVESTIW